MDEAVDARLLLLGPFVSSSAVAVSSLWTEVSLVAEWRYRSMVAKEYLDDSTVLVVDSLLDGSVESIWSCMSSAPESRTSREGLDVSCCPGLALGDFVITISPVSSSYVWDVLDPRVWKAPSDLLCLRSGRSRRHSRGSADDVDLRMVAGGLWSAFCGNAADMLLFLE